ncbi:hypothetical protein [uncultured Microbacterium sp.]|uniref:hypothetical protein n=1 Tax=uncultured Microbacterium sp. TaxID=191216 RepID=UPI0028EE8B6D|nr:hypothetical protein [uncultured Microbacterium sp.]
MTPTYTEGRTCAHCGRTLALTAFARRKRGEEARQGWCRECINSTRRDAYARRKEAQS